ncbi:sugar transferase [Roseobacteraceae bacterium S113]
MTMHLRQPTLGGEFEFGLSVAPVVSPKGVYRGFAKRAFDLLIVALIALPVTIVVLMLAVFVAMDGANPFYSQERLGRNGRRFRMWKLRSMVPNADAKLEAYLQSNEFARVEWVRSQKLRKDPRITPIGRIIRKTSLDELPQLLNVLQGEMSIVGPRPMMVCQRALYPGAAYYAMRPGITGYWQTSARNETSFSERALFDTAYFRDISLITDLKILARTVTVVLRGTGC